MMDKWKILDSPGNWVFVFANDVRCPKFWNLKSSVKIVVGGVVISMNFARKVKRMAMDEWISVLEVSLTL